MGAISTRVAASARCSRRRPRNRGDDQSNQRPRPPRSAMLALMEPCVCIMRFLSHNIVHFKSGGPAMNWDQVQGNWLQAKGKIKQQWAKLTDDDIGRINGKQEELLGLLQQRYGYAKEQAQKEVDNWVKTQKSIAA